MSILHISRVLMKETRERHEIIRDEIVAGLIKKGLTIKDFAMKLGKSQTAVGFCIRSVTSTKSIRKEIIKILGFNPWEKYPPVSYQYHKDGSKNDSGTFQN